MLRGVFAAFFLVGCLYFATADNLDYVRPTIGTYGEGFGVGSTPPGPQTPFGMVRLTPDTGTEFDDLWMPWNHFGGYYYADEYIRCFSHSHMVGSGVLDLGNIGVMPTTLTPSPSVVKDYGYRSSYTHRTEVVQPGYYAVNLDDPGIFAELTATKRVGVHRYKFPSTSNANYILFDVSQALKEKACVFANVSINMAKQEVTGIMRNSGSLSGRFGGLQVFFVAKFSSSFTGFGVWDNTKGTVSPGVASATGVKVGGWVQFGSVAPFNTVEVYVGISYVSINNARLNLQTELKNGAMKFQDVKTQTQNEWRDNLNMMQVTGGSDDDKIQFFTALYHTLLAPTTYSDANGDYLGFDSRVHNVNTFYSENSEKLVDIYGRSRKETVSAVPPAFMSDMSIWDVHRTEFPLLSLIIPDLMANIAQSLVLMFMQGGSLPRWPMANGYTCAMIGTHSNVVLSDAWLKGVKFDIQTAFKGMVQAATQPQSHCERNDLQDWLKLGFVDYTKDSVAACDTLAYALDDWALSNVATKLGQSQLASVFYNRSMNYKNVWNPSTKFFCPRSSDMEWHCPPFYEYAYPFDSRYVEGDAWQYRWFVPQDPAGLVQLFGSNDYFVEQLTEFFELSLYDPYNILPNPYYWAGNEPDIFAGYLFPYAKRPDLTQKYIRMVMETRYSSEPDGIPGNDDYGTMSAWFLFSSLGFYPQSGGTTYILGSPTFPQVTVNMAQRNHTIIVKANNVTKTNIYVQRVQVNGIPWNSPLIDHSQLTSNPKNPGVSTIEFWMGPSASSWGQ